MSCDHSSSPKPPLSYRIAHFLMGPFMKMAGLSCRHFAELCSSEMDRPLTRGERFRYRFHAMMCRLCRPLPLQFARLGEAVSCCPIPAPPTGEGVTLDAAARDRILWSLELVSEKDDQTK
jgi:hypothetical protein